MSGTIPEQCVAPEPTILIDISSDHRGLTTMVTAKLWETTRVGGVETTKLLKRTRRRFVRELTADCFIEGISSKWEREYRDALTRPSADA